MIFECQATGAAPLMYTWLHNGVDMQNQNQRRLEFYVRRPNEGEYSCRVENEYGSKKSESARLTVGEFIA